MKVAAAGRFRRQVTASVSNFVPKVQTPFQWAAQLPVEEVEARQEFLRRALSRHHIQFRWHDARLSYLEGIMSRGDRRVGPLILRAFQLGCRFDGWNQLCRVDLWEQALAETGLSADFYLRRRTLDEVLPWDHLSSGVTKEFLQRELARAFAQTLTPDCSVERCTFCGACDFETIRNVDYHLHGAKGGEHRGATVDHWASDLVAPEQPGAWEPRGWQKVHGTSGMAEPSRSAVATPAATGVPVAAGLPVQRSGSGFGNAEEWLNAGGEALSPGTLAAPAAQVRIRLMYGKHAHARFIGNLELATVFYRAARRARLPLAFSRGYHPFPRIAFGPALPLGVESECEFLDLDLVAAMTPDAVRAALAIQLPDGIRIGAAHSVPLRGPSIASQIAAFRYQVDLQSLAAVNRHRASV